MCVCVSSIDRACRLTQKRRQSQVRFVENRKILKSKVCVFAMRMVFQPKIRHGDKKEYNAAFSSGAAVASSGKADAPVNVGGV